MRGTHLPNRLTRTLEAEAGFNDPVAVLLVVALVELIQTPGYGAVDGIAYFVRELAVGSVVGVAVGALAGALLRRLAGAPSGLLLVSSAATAAVGYGAAAAIGGSGFLAVYLAGLVLGDRRIPARRAIRAFHSGLASVSEIGMFLAFGLLVFPSQLGDVLVEGTVLGLVVAFVARPLATLLATAFEPFSAAERALIGWAGLRGAVPVILATFPVIDGVPRSLEFFNIVFFAVLVSTVIQGSTVEALAARLGLAGPAATALD
jgi:cell volume regulation protein A